MTDIRGPATESRPFVAADVSAGDPLTIDHIIWRDVPAGLLPMPALTGAVALRPMSRGDPALAPALTYEPLIPDGWWSLEMRLPSGAVPGAAARVAVRDPALAADGVVVSIIGAGAFDAFASSIVAVPPQYADAIARTVPNGDVTAHVSR